MKYFIISDIHGFYDEMLEALKEKGFDENNPKHILISLGDHFDRGSKNVEVMNYLLKLYDKSRAILIRGNHEDLLESLLARRYLDSHDITNGTIKTIEGFSEYLTKKKRTTNEVINDIVELCGIIKKDKNYNRFIKALKDYYELDEYIMTHGFIPVGDNWGYPDYNPNWRNASTSEWEEARFLNGIAMASEYNIKIPNKTIIVGHYHASYGNVRKKYGFDIDERKAYDLEFSDLELFNPYVNDGIIGIDSCVVFSRKLNCLVIER